MVFTPEVANTKATVTIDKADQSTGEVRAATFSGIGDASPQNVSRNIVPHLIRMSETRAKARALRDAVNVGATSLEELSGDDDDGGGPGGSGGGSGGSSSSRQNGRQKSGSSSGGSSQGSGSGSDRSQSKAAQSQIEFLTTLAEEWAGENVVSRLENRIGKPLSELTREEAETWVQRLTPKQDTVEAAQG